MFIRQLYTGCLSEAAYFIESGGEAAVIDPLRDTDVYMDLAEERKARIRYIFETHFHADFISGYLDLAERTGAPIIFGPDTQTNLPVRLARDGERFQLGTLSLEALHTPGHTIESTCYLLRDEQGQPHSVFTGDTLFVGDVGRPDLFSANLSKEILAGKLFDSLRDKLKPLPDTVIVYPAHGPGSACGKNMGPETISTIGREKKSNYAMLAPDRETFISYVSKGLSAPPSYFSVNARINREGYLSLDKVLKTGLNPMSPEVFRRQAQAGALILDTREGETFSQGFLPGSINIGLEGRFAEWAGSLLPFDQPLLLVCDPGRESESVTRLARVGFENVQGYLEGGIGNWEDAGYPMDLIISVEPEELALDLPYDPNLVVLDVRRPVEFDHAHIRGALNIPLDQMLNPASLAGLHGRQKNYYLHCQGGYRSVMACSLLKREGIHNIRNIRGGMDRIRLVSGLDFLSTAAVLN